MPQGLEVYRADGSVLISIDSRVVRVVTVGNAGSGGNFTDTNNLVSVNAHMLVNSTNDAARTPIVTHNPFGSVGWSWAANDNRDTNAAFSILVL